MRLRCDVCGMEEEFIYIRDGHYPDNVIRFTCGYIRRETLEDIKILMRRHGGKR